jgi:ACS family hexuronate transporter-like MFS transporter
VLTPGTVYLLIQSAFYVVADVGNLLAGYTTRRLIYAGWPVERARKAVQLGSAALCLLAIPAVAAGRPWVTVPLLLVVAAGALGGFTNYYALTQDVAPRRTAQVLSFTGAAAWFSVAALHPVAGHIADEIKTFVPLFMVIGCVPMVGALVSLLWTPPRAETAPRAA